MKKQVINFRELLERLLPLDELPAPDRLHVQRALNAGVAEQIEQAALYTLSKLEQRGAVTRLPASETTAANTVRYQPRGKLDIITVEIPATMAHEGIQVLPRTALLPRAQAGLDQVRRLLRLDDPLLLTDPRQADARTRLRDQLRQAGGDVLGASEIRILPPPESEESIRIDYASDALAREASTRPDLIYYCPDPMRAPEFQKHALTRGAQSIVVAGMVSPAGEGLGLIEIESDRLDAFGLEDLGLVALLADYCSGVLERATHIEKMVFIDPLTSVYNRSYFDLQVDKEMARAQRERSSMALCIADIDNFKTFNSTFGYQAGNQVLVQVAESLKTAVRPFDTVARWGGEEFAVLLTAPIHGPDVMAICERLRTGVEKQAVQIESLEKDTHRVMVTVSIGVALFPDHANDSDSLWRAANQALLRAKQPPKNQVVFFEDPTTRRPRSSSRRSKSSSRSGGSEAGLKKIAQSMSAFGGPKLVPRPPADPERPSEES